MASEIDDFEVFMPPRHRMLDREARGLSVTIQKRGNITFDETVFEALGRPKAIKFYFHRAGRRIGMVGLAEKVRLSTKVYKASNRYVVSGVALCHTYNIDTQATRQYEAKMEEEMLIVDLLQSGSDVSRQKGQPDE